MNSPSVNIADPNLRDWIVAVVRDAFREQMDQAFSEKISGFVSENERRARELSIMERVVRVEEELRALREIEATRFEAAERRFESLQREMNARFEAMDKRFEAMDKRFEALQREMNARFEAMDKRFEAVDKRFEAVDKRFEAVDKRFEALQREMNARFEAMDKRFVVLQWMIGLGFSLVTVFMGFLKFWP
ncbi:hypothetical protein [Desulfosoma sp.]